MKISKCDVPSPSQRVRRLGINKIALSMVAVLGVLGCGRNETTRPRDVDPIIGTWLPDWKTTDEQFSTLPQDERFRTNSFYQKHVIWRQPDAFLRIGEDMVASVGITGLRNNEPMFAEIIGNRRYNMTRKRGGVGDTVEIDAADRLRIIGELGEVGPAHSGHIDACMYFSRKGGAP